METSPKITVNVTSPKPKRIAYVITSMNIGGTEKMVLSLIRHLPRDKYRIWLYSLKKPTAHQDEINQLPVQYIHLNFTEKINVASCIKIVYTIFKLTYLFRRDKIDIVDSFLFQANFISRIAGKLAGVPLIISSLRVMEVEKKFQLLINRWTNWLVDYITVNSDSLRNFTIEKERVLSNKVVTIYNGIESISPLSSLSGNDAVVTVTGDRETNNSLRTRHGIPAGYKIIGTVGRLHRQKGIDVLLQAMKQVLNPTKSPFNKGEQNRDLVFNIILLIVGDGPERDELESLAVQLGIRKQVIFTGWQTNVVPYISLFDIFVLSSRWEGFPNVVLETMCLAKPVIATRVSGVTEIITNQQTGIIVEPENSNQIAEQIVYLLTNPSIAHRMANNGYKYVTETFTIDKMVKNTELLYQQGLTKTKGIYRWAVI